MAEIDANLLPQRALVDTGVVIRALGERPHDPSAEACEAFWTAMLENSREILIAAPSLAEMIRHEGKDSFPRRRGVEVVAFDDRAAQELGRRFPERVLQLERDVTKLPKHYIKYDALIVACAVRHKATHVVTLDNPLTSLAGKAGLQVVPPTVFLKAQLPLPGT